MNTHVSPRRGKELLRADRAFRSGGGLARLMARLPEGFFHGQLDKIDNGLAFGTLEGHLPDGSVREVAMPDTGAPRIKGNRVVGHDVVRAVTGARPTMIGAEHDGRSSLEICVRSNEIEELSQVAVDRDNRVSVRSRSPAGSVSCVIGVGVVDECVLKVIRGQAGKHLALHRRGNLRRRGMHNCDCLRA